MPGFAKWCVVFFASFIPYLLGAVLGWSWRVLGPSFVVWAVAFLQIQWMTFGPAFERWVEEQKAAAERREERS